MTCELECNQIVTSVFAAMFGMEVSCLDNRVVDAEFAAASIDFTGTWKGSMLFECERAQAPALASKLMSVVRPDDEDVADSLGEIVNTIGGNFKALLPRGVTLSMPKAFRVGDSLRGSIVNQGLYGSEYGNFRVTVFEQV